MSQCHTQLLAKSISISVSQLRVKNFYKCMMHATQCQCMQCSRISTDAPEVTASNSSSLGIVLGEELHLQCSYVGVPAPIAQWFRDGIILSDGVNGVSINTGDNVISILIGSVERTNMGTYTCRANNTLGVDQQSYSVMILGKSVVAS